ncbi:MAG: nuclear transport factor 2 family protein [Chthoniobacterales bacterium]|nr:nuclear transport factor 2 family protein [Chthoniobacterales bacterium]
MKYILPAAILLVALAFSTASHATDQKATPESRELFELIARMDSAMFEALNAHDAEKLMSMFTEDLEFYHDKGGVTNYQQTAENFKKMFANNPGIRRDLVQGSLEVYPLKDYGAIEIGTHRFCHQENGKDDCGSFKFVMVWRNTGNSWKVSRVISYGH